MQLIHTAVIGKSGPRLQWPAPHPSIKPTPAAVVVAAMVEEMTPRPAPSAIVGTAGILPGARTHIPGFEPSSGWGRITHPQMLLRGNGWRLRQPAPPPLTEQAPTAIVVAVRVEKTTPWSALTTFVKETGTVSATALLPVARATTTEFDPSSGWKGKCRSPRRRLRLLLRQPRCCSRCLIIGEVLKERTGNVGYAKGKTVQLLTFKFVFAQK